MDAGARRHGGELPRAGGRAQPRPARRARARRAQRRARARHARRATPGTARLAAGRGAERACGYLLELAEREGLDGWVLIPTHDEEAALIARHRDALARSYRLTTPPWEMLRAAYDKRRTHELGARLGLDQPWTVFPDGAAELELAEGRFPVVIKPAYKAPRTG